MSDKVSDSVTALNLEHNGNGHIAGRDVNITNNYQYVTSENLTNIAEDLIYTISASNSDKALHIIKVYQNFTSLPAEAITLFTILTNFIESSKEEKVQFDINYLKKSIRKTNNNELKELYQSLHIRATFNQEGHEQAKAVYDLYSNDANYYLLAVYDSLLSTSDELDSRYKNDLLGLDNYTLFTLAQGLWRFDRFEEAKKVLERISSSGASNYISCLMIASDYNNVVKVPNLQSYAYLPPAIAHKLRYSINDFLEIISHKDTLAPIELDLLIAMTNGFGPYVYQLMEQALRFKTVIAKKDPEMGEWLEFISNQKPLELSSEIVTKLHVGDAIDQTELSKCLTALKHKVLNVQVMQTWLENSGKVIGSDKLFMEFLNIFILSFENYEGTHWLIEYKEKLDIFIDKYGNDLRSISAIYIMAFIDNLYSFSDTFEVSIYNILERVCQNIAVDSELYLFYLKSLLRLSKLKTLKREIDRVDKEEWTNSLYAVHARYLLEVSEYDDAIDIYQKFIDSTKNLYFWHNYLLCCTKSSKGLAFAKQELERIPKELFSINTIGFDFFIIQVGNFVDYRFIKKLLIELFAKSPSNYARIFSRLFLSRLATRRIDKLDEVENYDGIHQGLVYEVNGKRKQGLLVDSWLANSKSKELINIEMPLGKMLISMNEGDLNELEYDDIRLVERQEISTTVFQLALQITHESRHNYKDKIFHMFETTEATAYEDFVKMMQKLDKNDNTSELIEDPEIPLYLKGRKLTGSHVSGDEFETAHRLLLNPSANKCLTVSGGDSLVSESMIIDVYGFIYLCLTGLYESVIASKIAVYITCETDSTIELWINNITHEDFNRVSEDNGQLTGIGSEFVNHELGDFIDNVEKLRSHSKIQAPNIHDLPTIVSQMDSLISSSIVSSIRLSVANDIPWLCLDSFIRNILMNEGNVKIVNFTYFVEEYVNRHFLKLDDRKHAMTLWADTGLFTVYSYQDLLTLSQSMNDLPLLTKILNDTPLNFPNSAIADRLLGGIIKSLSLKTLTLTSSINNTQIIENAIYACLKKALESLDYNTQEERIGRIAFYVISDFPLEVATKNTFNIIAKFAIGHFMNINEINKILHSQTDNFS